LYKKSIYCISYILLLLAFSNTNLYSSELKSANINPLNRVIFYFDELPQFKSVLSSNKMNITIQLENVSSSMIEQIEGEGVIQKATIISNGTNASILINLNDRRGFTASPLYFSNAILVEVFEWNKLSKEEDEYRQALFALESGSEDQAIELLNKSSKSNYSNAKAYLAIIAFKNNDTENAKKYSKEAIETGTNLPDAFGIQWKISESEANSEKAEKYKNFYFKMTGKMLSNDEPTSHLNTFSDEEKPLEDSLEKTTPKIDEATKKDSSITVETENVFSFENIFNYAPAIFFVLAAIALITIFLTRKPKQKVKAPLAKTNQEFEHKLQKAKLKRDGTLPKKKVEDTENDNIQSTNNPLDLINKAANDAKKKGKKLDKTLGTEDFPKKTNEIKDPNDIPISPISNIHLESPSKKIEDFLEKFIPQKASEQTKPLAEQIKEIDIDKEFGANHVTGQAELAMHLADEMQKIKQKNLQSISEKDIPKDSEKAKDIAKELGIETSTLETKSNLAKLKGDSKLMSKLSQKFTVNTDNDEEKSE